MNRDPFDVYSEHRDRQDEQRITKADIGKTHARQVSVSIGYQELAALLLREFRSQWETSTPYAGLATLFVAEEVLAKAIASSLVEMRDVRVLTDSDKAEGSSLDAAPSVSLLSRFWKRVTRSPWRL